VNLVYFTQEAYKSLKKDVESNKEKYYEDIRWLNEYFESNNIQDFKRTTDVTVGNITFQHTGDDTEANNQDDLQNTITLYDAYKGKVSPSQATDPCLWTALSHIPNDYRKYILKRWRRGDGTVSLEQRFFATEARANLLYFNAISRLWWSGYLTYDEAKARTNPWELTKILFSAQQIQKDLFDQPFSKNRTVVKGLLKALKRIQEEAGNAATTPFRKCCNSYINHYGAVTILDTLSATDIEDLAYKHMKSLI
jgi:hypothetical protein